MDDLETSAFFTKTTPFLKRFAAIRLKNVLERAAKGEKWRASNGGGAPAAKIA